MELVAQELGRSFDNVGVLQGTTYRDCRTVLVVPTRGMMHHRFVAALHGLIAPPNQPRNLMFAAGDEVGKAYDNLIMGVLNHPEMSKWPYVMTVEDDNLLPVDAHIRLLEAIDTGPRWDAVSGLYWTKGDVFNMPMAYGDPEEYERTGVLEFRPRDVKACLSAGQLMPVNGIAMGCALWRLDLFRAISPPWFVTVGDVVPEKGPMLMTQDLWFCRRAREMGKKFAVDMRVKVGHLDVNTGVVY